MDQPQKEEATGPGGSRTEGSSGSDGGSGPGAPSEHVRPPRQERSRETLERIVDAARELISEEGVQAATVSRVVERADSSVGSFYARFDGKDDLLRYLEERVWTVARERWEEALASRSWDDLELEGVVRTVIRMLVRIEVEDAGTRRALEREARGRLGLGRESRRFHDRVEKDVRDLLLRHRKRMGHPRPERGAAVAYRWAVGGIRELLAPERLGEETALEAEAVTDEVTRGLVAYLGGAAEARPADEGVEFFDVWQ